MRAPSCPILVNSLSARPSSPHRMRMSTRRPSWLALPHASLLTVLLVVTLLIGALLAREAHRAAKSHARMTRRALQDYASVAAWEFLSGVEGEVDAVAGDALAPMTAGRATTPFDSLPSPAALLPALSAVDCPGRTAPRALRVDLRDRSV